MSPTTPTVEVDNMVIRIAYPAAHLSVLQRTALALRAVEALEGVERAIARLPHDLLVTLVNGDDKKFVPSGTSG